MLSSCFGNRKSIGMSSTVIWLAAFYLLLAVQGTLLTGTPKTIPELQEMIRNGQGPKTIPGVKEAVYAIPAGRYGIPRDHLQILDQSIIKIASLFSDGRWYGLERKQLTNPEFWLWLDSINWSRPKPTPMQSLAELIA